MSIDRWMEKQNVAYTYNGILFSHIEEQNSDTCYIIAEPWKYAEWNKPDAKEQIIYDFTYIMYLE